MKFHLVIFYPPSLMRGSRKNAKRGVTGTREAYTRTLMRYELVNASISEEEHAFRGGNVTMLLIETAWGWDLIRCVKTNVKKDIIQNWKIIVFKRYNRSYKNSFNTKLIYLTITKYSVPVLWAHSEHRPRGLKMLMKFFLL